MSERSDTFTVEITLPSERLDRFLHTRYPMASRSALQRLIEEGEITVNGEKVKPTHAPHVGDVVKVHWPDPRPDKAEAEDMPITVIYEDESLLVVNKSPDIAVHPGNGHERHTSSLSPHPHSWPPCLRSQPLARARALRRLRRWTPICSRSPFPASSSSMPLTSTPSLK